MAGSSIIGALRVNLGIDTAAFTKGLASARKSLASAGQQMKSIGTQTSISITAPVVAFGASILKTAGDFEASMNNVGAVTSATADEMGRLGAQAKELGRTTQFSASQAAEAMGFLGMTGFKTDEIIGAMPGTLQLAAAAQMDLASAADTVSNVLSGYGLEVEDLGRVNDVLVKTFTSANTDLRQLGEAMKYAGPIASSAGVSFEMAAAAIGLMGNAGIQASMAGTSLKGAISRVLTPTKKVSSAMARAGLNFTNAQGRLIGLDEIIRQLEPHAEDTGLFMEIFGQRAGPAMAALVSQGADALAELTEELENSGGTAKRISEAQMQGLNGKLKELSSAFEGLKLAIADSGLLEFVTQAVAGLTRFVQGLGETNPEILKWGTILAGVAALLGPVVLAIGGVAIALSAISLPVAAGIAAVAALGGVFLVFGDQITGALGRAWSAIQSTLGAPLQALGSAAADVLRSLGELFGSVFGADSGTGLGDTESSLGGLLATAGELVASGLLDALATGVGALTLAFESAASVVRILAALFRGDFRGALEKVGTLAGRIKDSVVNAFDDMVTPVRGAIGRVFTAVVDGLGELPGEAQALGRSAVDGIVTGIQEATESVRAVVAGIADVVSEAADNLQLPDAFAASLSAVQQAADLAREAIGNVAAIIDGYFLSVLADAGAVALGLGDDLVAAFTDAVGSVREAIVDIAFAIKEELGKLPAQLLELGKDAIRGLISGISSMAGGVRNAVVGVGRSAVNVLTGLWDEHSPSKVFHEIGAYAIEGLANGIDSMRGTAVAAAEETAAKVAQAIAMVNGGGADPLGKLKTSTGEATEGLREMEGVGQTLGSTLGSAITGLINGTKKFKDVVADLLGKLAEMFVNSGFKAIMSGFPGLGGGAGGGGGFLSGLFSGLGNAFKGLLGFANGGSMSIGGGNNKMDNQVAAMRVSAGETVKVTRGEDDSGGGVAAVRVYVDDNGNWDAKVEGISRGVSEKVAQAGFQAYDRQMRGSALLDRVNSAQMRFA